MELGAKTQARLGRIIDFAYYVLILVGFYLFMRFAFWLVFPFLFAFFIAMVLQKPMNYAHRKIKLKKSFSSLALVLLFYVAIVLLIVLIGVRLWGAMKSFGGYLSGLISDLPNIVKDLQLRINQLLAWLPDGIETRMNTALANFTDTLLSGVNAQGESVGVFGNILSLINLEWFKAPAEGVLSVAGRIPGIAVAVVITVISSFFMTSSYDALVGFLKRQLKPERRAALSAAKRIMFSSMAKLVRSYVLIIFISFAELLLGFLLLKLIGVYNSSQLVGVAAITAVVDILPVLGVGTVLVPWALYNFIMGNFGMGIGLVVIFVVMTVIRQIIEPKLVSANLGLPAIVTVMGMYIGLQLFGFIGMFLVPLVITLIKLLNDEGVLHIWKTENKKKPPAKVPAKTTKPKESDLP